MEKSIQAQTSVLKSQFFSTGDQSYGNKSFIFQFLTGVGVYVQMFMIGPCAIAKLHIFGHSRSNIT